MIDGHNLKIAEKAKARTSSCGGLSSRSDTKATSIRHVIKAYVHRDPFSPREGEDKIGMERRVHGEDSTKNDQATYERDRKP